MAYNNYFPATYQPAYYGQPNPYYQQMAQQQAMMQQQQAQAQQGQTQHPPIQQSGFVLVQSEQEARAYPVAPGNSITFKDETAPFCYVKTMGFNQLDRPTFERYRLVKEETPSQAPQEAVKEDKAEAIKEPAYALKTDLVALWDAVDEIKEEMHRRVERKSAKEVKADDE